MRLVRSVKTLVLRILSVALRIFALSPRSHTFAVYLSGNEWPCRIPAYFAKRFIFDHVVQPLVRTAPEEALVRIGLPRVSTPLYLRAHTTDLPAFVQIFQLRDYEFPLAGEPQFIIDGGANVGYASVFFANKYPQAKIIAVEPEESNCRLFAKNCAGYPNIELVPAAIWGRTGRVRIKDIGLGSWGFVVEEAAADDPRSVAAVTIAELLHRSGKSRIDILKLDIEGAEQDVFSGAYASWLEKVNVLIIELHDHLTPGCSAAFSAAIGQYDFQKMRRGENIILVKHEA